MATTAATRRVDSEAGEIGSDKFTQYDADRAADREQGRERSARGAAAE